LRALLALQSARALDTLIALRASIAARALVAALALCTDVAFRPALASVTLVALGPGGSGRAVRADRSSVAAIALLAAVAFVAACAGGTRDTLRAFYAALARVALLTARANFAVLAVEAVFTVLTARAGYAARPFGSGWAGISLGSGGADIALIAFLALRSLNAGVALVALRADWADIALLSGNALRARCARCSLIAFRTTKLSGACPRSRIDARCDVDPNRLIGVEQNAFAGRQKNILRRIVRAVPIFREEAIERQIARLLIEDREPDARRRVAGWTLIAFVSLRAGCAGGSRRADFALGSDHALRPGIAFYSLLSFWPRIARDALRAFTAHRPLWSGIAFWSGQAIALVAFRAYLTLRAARADSALVAD
jgi:hypothetical protein